MARRPADTVIVGGRVTTMRTDEINDAQALAVSGDRVAAVGSESEIRALIDDETLVIDVGGRTVIPGLIDAHVHFARAGFTWENEVRWGTVTSLAEGLSLIAERADSLPPGEWITVIGGWHPFQFAEKQHPTIEDLDRVAPDHPVLVQFLYEYGMLNTLGKEFVPLERAAAEGVAPDTVEQDDRGAPTGVVRSQHSLKWLYAQLPVPSFEDQVRSTIAAGREFARFGITGVIDGGGVNTGPDVYGPIFEVWRRRELTPRVRLLMHSGGPGAEEAEIGGYLRFIPSRVGDEKLSVLGVGEVILWPLHDHVPRPPTITPENVSRAEAIFRDCAGSGRTVQMHIIHPDTTELVIDMWSRVHASTPIDGLRWTIVH
ncbi:MAG: amidohydrolase family protein, partial [Acidimicrobiia bacterium]|nr:amidohydrolase family protein [Acidimicrobiia bacterium]